MRSEEEDERGMRPEEERRMDGFPSRERQEQEVEPFIPGYRGEGDVLRGRTLCTAALHHLLHFLYEGGAVGAVEGVFPTFGT